jgi:hypothetical protein
VFSAQSHTFIFYSKVVNAMAKPLDTHSDKELEGALAEGQLTERKGAVAEEILRRRQDAKTETLREKHGWLGVVLAAFGLVIFSLKRFWRRQAS